MAVRAAPPLRRAVYTVMKNIFNPVSCALYMTHSVYQSIEEIRDEAELYEDTLTWIYCTCCC